MPPGHEVKKTHQKCIKKFQKKKLVRNVKLEIAGYRIGFEAETEGLSLSVSKKFLTSISSGTYEDITIRVHRSEYYPEPDAAKVFHAPFVEEIDGIIVQNNPDFWSIWKNDSSLFIKIIFPLSKVEKKAVLRFSLAEKEWNLWIDTDETEVDPLEYPLDGLILYYLTVINNDIMIHASGVSHDGEGYLFTGISGKGKSTMANLWAASGAQVIHDDRLIIRKKGDGYRMFNTPVYDNDYPLSCPLSKIFVIEHGKENIVIPLKGAASVSQIMANCIQHAWDSRIIGNLMESVSGMCNIIPSYKLNFTPKRSVIDFILKKDEHPR